MISQHNIETVLKIITKLHKGFQICHFNARSLTSCKIDYLNYILPEKGVDVFTVSETWFKPELDDRFYELNNYKLIRHDRQTDARGGGIALYTRNYLKVRILFKSTAEEAVEYMGVELSGNDNSKCMLICVYNPSRSNNLENLFAKLADIALQYEKIVVCGDFNINLLNDDHKARMFLNSITSCGLLVVNNLPTRYGQNCTPALLDLVLCSSSSLSIHFDQLTLGGLSDHDMLIYVCDFNFQHDSQNEKIVHDFKSINMDMLFTECLQIDFTMIWRLSDVNEKLDLFNNIVVYLYEKFVPKKVIKQRKSKPPWYNSSVKDSIKTRNKFYVAWKNNPTVQNWNIFKKARNKSNAATKKAKCEFYRRHFGSSELTTKTLWKKLENMGVKKKKQFCELNADVLNQHFLSSSQSSISSNHPPNPNSVYNGPNFNFSSFYEPDVLLALKSIKSDAVGHDRINLKFIKILLPFVLSSITHIFNHIITTSQFPSVWKIANIIPVNKKSSPLTPNDYRPISILSALSKAFEKLLSKQINQHNIANKLLSTNQSGFQTAKSCNTATLKVLDDLRPSFDKGDLSIIVFIDFSKAFDMVNFELLLYKLINYFGFSLSAKNLLESYLFERCQYVTTKTGISNMSAINSGVPQGSILGPILFTMFINDIAYCLKNSSIHLYADDAQIYMSRPPGLKEDLGVRINEDLFSICKWAESNKLQINAGKTQAICVHHTSLSKEDFPPIYMDNSPIEYVDVVKSLGFQINSKLTCTHHINFIVLKIYNVLRMLWFSASFLPADIKLKLIHSLILPLILYAANVYGDLDAESLRKLQLAVNNCARFVFKKRKFDHISHLTHNILGSSIVNFLHLRNVLFMHKLIFSKTPVYLYCKLNFFHSNRINNLILPKCKLKSTSRMFFISAVKVWNSLPMYLKNESNYFKFKSSVSEMFKSQH